MSVHLSADKGEHDESILEYTGYFGHYSVDEIRSVVIHKVSRSSVPDLIGTRQERGFRFDRNFLILSTEIDGARMKLIWKREIGSR